MSIGNWITGTVGKVLDKIIPDKEKRLEAKIKLAEMEQEGEFKYDELRFQAMANEAKSEHKYVALARPTFMYVMYVYLLSAIPFGVFGAFYPMEAKSVGEGMKMWFEAIPSELYVLFGTGYLGYAVSRSTDKKNNLKNLNPFK